ncbi:MAG: helix-turn-helix transcriptional regulator [Ruminococcaceae bacterium]|nr:helix-turn-helix transcriptional regulator [Oscillospiraceae bacterium]
METVGRIICYGSSRAPADSWHCKKHIGINRLYYIHSGVGGYTHGGREYPFVKGMLYFIPYTADFTPFCDSRDPIMHTYIDFELIPPIITSEVISLGADSSETIARAKDIFVLGARADERDARDISALYSDPTLWELSRASIIYLVNQLVSANGIERITDRVVIKALEMMHLRMSERLSIKDMARDCYMSPDSFIRRFSRVVGITPHAYIRNLRLRSAQYLRESGMGLSQIANEVGYADAASLLHALKNIEKTQ